MRIGLLVAPSLALCLAVTGVSAHHSFAAQFDPEQPISLHGVVTKIEWMNPHVYFFVDVEDAASGQTENWGIEMGPPHQLQRRNWKRNSMAIGDVISVEATRARDGSFLANARRVTLDSTGEVLGAASSEAQTIGRK
jgi:hypothetical protein